MRRRVASAWALALVACSSSGRPSSPPAPDAPRAPDAPPATPTAPAPAVAEDDVAPSADPREPGGVAGLITLAAPMPAATRPGGAPPCRPAAAIQLSPYAGVVGALVWLEPVAGAPPALPQAASATPRLAVDGCAWTPRAVLLPASGALVLENVDGWRHEVLLGGAGVSEPPPTWVLPVQGSTYEVTLAGQGPFRLTLDDGALVALAMPWPSPWATITDVDGKFALPGVPAGRYRLRAAHPAPGGGLLTATLEVEVPPGVTLERPLGLAAP